MVRKSSKVDGRPAVQWYVKDYLSDANLAACSLAAQGLWVRMLCLMYQAPERGCLVFLDGRDAVQPVGLGRLAQLVGHPLAEVSALVDELVREGAAGIEPSGMIYNRRMRREAEKEKALRANRRAAGAKGGRVSRKGAAMVEPDRAPERLIVGIQRIQESRGSVAVEPLAEPGELAAALGGLCKQSEAKVSNGAGNGVANGKQNGSITPCDKLPRAKGL